MKKYLLKTISALLTGVMLVGMAVPAMADIADIQVIDLASAPMVISAGTPENYPTPTGTDISINIVGAGKTESVNTSSLEAGKFAKIKAEKTLNSYNFSHYEYVTTARNYVASYDNEFTFYVDPPMTINVVYATDPITSANGIVAGMYKNPEVKSDGNTYFYCSVAGAKGNNTTAEITFGRSQKDERDTDNNSETITTATEQNIYDEEDTNEHNTFQYIVSSGIQTGGPIDFEAKVNANSTALIKTWDLHSGAFYGKTNGTVNDLKIDGNTYSFNANIGDKVRVEAISEPTSVSGIEKTKSVEGIYEYKVTGDLVTIQKDGINKIMVNPMDVAITEGGQPSTPSPDKNTTGTIIVNVQAIETGTNLSGANVTAKKSDNKQFTFTIPETDEGIYSISAPEGTYDITVELNGQTASGSIVVENDKEKSVTISIKDIEAERQKKIDTMIERYLTEQDPTDSDGSLWNSESSEFKWSYINGCMITAFMDLYDITKEERYLNTSDIYQSKFIDNDGKVISTKNKDADIRKNFALDDVNPGKSLLDLMEAMPQGANYNKYNNCVEGTLKYVIENTSKTKAGNFWHKDSYPHQVWLDGTYMALPYMIQYSRVTGKGFKGLNDITAVADNVVLQFNNVYNKMRNVKTGLYYHGYDAQADPNGDNDTSKAMSWAKGTTYSNSTYKVGDGKPSTSENVGCSSNYWTRAMGWYAMALVDSYEELDKAEKENKGTFTTQKQTIAKIFTDLMDHVINYQDEKTGLWWQVTDKQDEKGNYLETSGSATFAAALMKGYNINIYNDAKDYNSNHTPEQFYALGLKAFNGITDNKLDNGVISDICGTAGLAGPDGSGTTSKTATRGDSPYKYRDGTYDYYVSEKVANDDAKGSAPYLMAYAQKLKHDKDLQSANS